MLHFKRTFGFWVAVALLLSGCAQPFNQLQSEQAAQVEMRLDASVDVSDCEWKGDVTGSEGYWYTYLFFKNDSLTQGAVNGIKNHAAALGGDTVLLLSPVYFSTSVTLFGSAIVAKNKAEA